MRTPFQETSEALFLTSGYAYEAAEEAEARFKGEIGGYQYSRFGNPTVSMFEERMAALEGAPVARATATGMAAVSRRVPVRAEDRRSCGGGQGHVRLLPACDRGDPAALRHHLHPGGRRAMSAPGKRR